MSSAAADTAEEEAFLDVGKHVEKIVETVQVQISEVRVETNVLLEIEKPIENENADKEVEVVLPSNISHFMKSLKDNLLPEVEQNERSGKMAGRGILGG